MLYKAVLRAVLLNMGYRVITDDTHYIILAKPVGFCLLTARADYDTNEVTMCIQFNDSGEEVVHSSRSFNVDLDGNPDYDKTFNEYVVLVAANEYELLSDMPRGYKTYAFYTSSPIPECLIKREPLKTVIDKLFEEVKMLVEKHQTYYETFSVSDKKYSSDGRDIEFTVHVNTDEDNTSDYTEPWTITGDGKIVAYDRIYDDIEDFKKNWLI